MKNKFLSVMLCVALLLALTPVAIVPAQEAPREVRIGLAYPINQLDPQLAANSTEALLVEQLFLGLVGLDEQGNIVPELAQTWDISDDGVFYTFSLREGVQWSSIQRGNIREVNAEDVAFSIDRAREFGNFEGVIEAVQVVDDYTVTIIMQGFFPDFLTVLAISPAAKIVPNDLVLEAGEDVWTLPGTMWNSGPYLLVGQSRTGVVLEANPFWDGDRTDTASLVRVEYTPDPLDALRRFVNNDLDLIEAEIEFYEALSQDPGYAERQHFEPGSPLDLFNQSFFAQQTGFGHGYLVKDGFLPLYSSYFGLGAFHLWGFNQQTPEVQIAENARVLNNETLGALESLDEQGTLTFAIGTTQLELLQMGDILVGRSTIDVGTEAAPFGFLLRAVNIRRDGGRFVIDTVPAMLDEVVVRASLNQPLTVDLDNVYEVQQVSSAPPGDRSVPAAYTPPYAGLSMDFDTVLHDEDGDETTENDQLRLKGKVNVEQGAGFQLSLDIQNNQLQSLRFTNNLKQTAELEVVSSVTLASFEKILTIKRYIFAPITILIGYLPVVITPEISIVAGLNGQVAVAISTGITQSSNITLGVEYENGNWNDILEVNEQHVSPLTMDLSQKARARAFAGPELAVTLYGVAGPYGRVQGYLELNADPTADPLWALYGGIDGEAGIKAQIFSVIDLRTRVTFDIFGPELLGEQGRIIPTATFMPTVKPTATPPSTNPWGPALWLLCLCPGVGLVGVFIIIRQRRKKQE